MAIGRMHVDHERCQLGLLVALLCPLLLRRAMYWALIFGVYGRSERNFVGRGVAPASAGVRSATMRRVCDRGSSQRLPSQRDYSEARRLATVFDEPFFWAL